MMMRVKSKAGKDFCGVLTMVALPPIIFAACILFGWTLISFAVWDWSLPSKSACDVLFMGLRISVFAGIVIGLMTWGELRD